MTTSVPLHILFVMSALLLIADDLFIISPHLLLVNNFFQFFQFFYLSAVFLLSHRLFTLVLRILCFLFILRLSPLFALFCFQYTGQFICRLSKMYFHLKYPAETVLILSLFRRIFYSNTVRTAGRHEVIYPVFFLLSYRRHSVSVRIRSVYRIFDYTDTPTLLQEG